MVIGTASAQGQGRGQGNGTASVSVPKQARVNINDQGNGTANKFKNRMGLKLHKGWNLVSLPDDGNLTLGNCTIPPHAFAYMHNESKFESLKNATKKMGPKANEFLRNNAFWVYSFEDCDMPYKVKAFRNMNKLKLRQGLNFVPISQDMPGKRLKDIKGDCEFAKANLWNVTKQNWQEMTESDEFPNGTAYGGFVAKVRRACGFMHKEAAQALS